MSNVQVGMLLIAAGALAFVITLSLQTDGFAWIGHLPGDIRVARASAQLLLPFTSLLLLSIVSTAMLRVFFSFMRRVF